MAENVLKTILPPQTISEVCPSLVFEPRQGLATDGVTAYQQAKGTRTAHPERPLTPRNSLAAVSAERSLPKGNWTHQFFCFGDKVNGEHTSVNSLKALLLPLFLGPCNVTPFLPARIVRDVFIYIKGLIYVKSLFFKYFIYAHIYVFACIYIFTYHFWSIIYTQKPRSRLALAGVLK